MTATQIIPYLFYRDVASAMTFLQRAFGFVEEMRHETPSGGLHAEMSLAGQRIMMGQGSRDWRMQSPEDVGTSTIGVFVYLPDVDAHCERARAAGADIVEPVKDQPYGRTYTARDCEGHAWFFTTPPAA